MYIIAVLGQKGGVGKSTLSQLIAQGYAANQYRVLLADMNAGQSTSQKWGAMRESAGIAPLIHVKGFRTIPAAHKEGVGFDLIIFDGSPQATAQTLEIAKSADLVLLPTSTSKYDLDPQITLAHDLVAHGLPADRLLFVLSRVISTENDLQQAFMYIAQTPYRALQTVLEEKTGYRAVAEQGKALTETHIPTLRAKGKELFGSVAAAMMKIVAPSKTNV